MLCHAVPELIDGGISYRACNNVRTPPLTYLSACVRTDRPGWPMPCRQIGVSSGLAAHLCLQAGCCPAVMSVARAARASRSDEKLICLGDIEVALGPDAPPIGLGWISSGRKASRDLGGLGVGKLLFAMDAITAPAMTGVDTGRLRYCVHGGARASHPTPSPPAHQARTGARQRPAINDGTGIGLIDYSTWDGITCSSPPTS